MSEGSIYTVGYADIPTRSTTRWGPFTRKTGGRAWLTEETLIVVVLVLTGTGVIHLRLVYSVGVLGVT